MSRLQISLKALGCYPWKVAGDLVFWIGCGTLNVFIKGNICHDVANLDLEGFWCYEKVMSGYKEKMRSCQVTILLSPGSFCTFTLILTVDWVTGGLALPYSSAQSGTFTINNPGDSTVTCVTFSQLFSSLRLCR